MPLEIACFFNFYTKMLFFCCIYKMTWHFGIFKNKLAFWYVFVYTMEYVVLHQAWSFIFYGHAIWLEYAKFDRTCEKIKERKKRYAGITVFRFSKWKFCWFKTILIWLGTLYTRPCVWPCSTNTFSVPLCDIRHRNAVGRWYFRPYEHLSD